MVMEEKDVLKSCLIVSEARDDSLRAMYIGISCAFYVVENLSNKAVNNQKCLETWDKMVLGSAQLLGLLIWRVQRAEVKSSKKCELFDKLKAAKREIIELKRIRSEDAKANEKVACIYAAQEQSWFSERRRLKQQIGSLMNDLRILDKRKNEAVSELNGKLQEMEISMKSKDKMLKEEENKRKELEEKVKSMEAVLEELRETTKREAQDHSSELLKHKTAFIELISNQRQLEAELGRALRRVEATKQQLDFVFEEKEEAVLMAEELSMEIQKMRKESEQKDKVLSAMMRKLKLDSPEKQMLLKEVKLSKPKWKRNLGSRNERCNLRNMLPRQLSSRFEVLPAETHVNETKPEQSDNVLGDLVGEVRKENEDYSVYSEQRSPEECTEFDEVARVDEWVHSEAEKYHNAVEQRHQLELEAFAEQMRLKDDKIEAYQWRLSSAELESKRLRSKIEGLNQGITQLQHNNLKLETLLEDREGELKNLKEQFALQLNNLTAEKTKSHSSRREMLLTDNTVRSQVKIIKKKQKPRVEQEQQVKTNLAAEEAKNEKETEPVSACVEDKEGLEQPHSANIEVSSPEGSGSTGEEGAAAKPCLNRRDTSPWKVDLNALGVSYKIKRLNQQLLILDRLAGKQESGEFKGSNEHGQTRMTGFSLLLSLVNKQVSRYQSLQEKTDDLSKRMGEKNLNVKQGVSSSKRTKEETRTLEHFLEETFQLQRFIVATGQKLMEIQSKISSGFVGIANELDGSASFDMKRFADTIQSLFKDVQRGLEVRISRIIGDLEGTLACDGIHFWE